MVQRHSSRRQPDLLAENQRLKRENARLRAATAQVHTPGSRHILRGLRSAGAVFFVCLAVLLLFAGNLFFWTGNTIVNTDRYMQAVGPLISKPAVQTAIAQYTTDQLFRQVDVEAFTEQALPPKAAFLAPQLAEQVETGAETALKRVLARPQFQDRWLDIQRRQHERLVTFAADYQGSGTIDLNDVYQQLAGNLKDTKLSFLADKQLPPKVGSITVVTASWLPAFHTLVTHINTWRLLAVTAMLVSLGLALWLSRHRLRVLYGFGWGAAGLMLVTLIGLRYVQHHIGNRVDSQYAAAARETAATVFHPLVTQTWLILALALVVVLIAAAINGKFGWALAAGRRGWAYMEAGAQHMPNSWRTAPALRWLTDHKRAVEYGLGVLLALVMLFITPSLPALIVLILVLAALIAVIELLTSPPPQSR